ncbi:glucuronate isomerase [Vagococcus sp. BWB3-3]|uniref:Uronate isomerase n=1 Tax=Vagococcus allomyrinae TaxID=2794353 RepID=A0A940PI10_9ENTE|nr:glucuronate isomerase [Vagococcus allomyrinae]MBP1043956.1 glucuronate isomerase [Vagococcus allomyrinae]
MFLDDNFLLTTPTAVRLFHDFAKEMPIIDYHCHLDPQEIYEDRAFATITEAWLAGDHYKWRLMRANGIPESQITGDASDYDKFLAWAKTVPKTIGNPLYAWTHLELRRFFGIEELLNEETAPEIWQKVNERLALPAYSRRQLIANSKVKIVCTTDDPVDDLRYHQLLKKEESAFQVLPAFRPDKALNIDAPEFTAWLKKLADVAAQPITNYPTLLSVLEKRIDFFHENGCRLSDHALDTLNYQAGSPAEVEQVFQKALEQEPLTASEIALYRTETLVALIKCYHQKNWTMQLHLHAHRNNNQRMLNQLGPDSGYDSLNDLPIATPLKEVLDRAEASDQLPQTILYSLNPQDYPVLLTLLGCYQKDTPGKLQLGSGWWFNDTRSGMREQLSLFAENSLLSHFVGMLTDSRSFLSYTRHEYFRRVLCELMGEWAQRGEVPDDDQLLGQMVADIAYNNANRYFKFK